MNSIHRIFGMLYKLRRRPRYRAFGLDIPVFVGVFLFLILAIGVGEFSLSRLVRADRIMTARVRTRGLQLWSMWQPARRPPRVGAFVTLALIE